MRRAPVGGVAAPTIACYYVHELKAETNRRKVIQRLEHEGWVLTRTEGRHDVYTHGAARYTIPVPRHRTLSPGVARSIAKRAGWI